MIQKFITATSIRTKILIGYVLIIFCVSVFIYTYYPFKFKQQAINSIELKIKSVVNMMSIGLGIGMGELDLVAINKILEWAKHDNYLSYILVTDQHNHQVAAYNPNKINLDLDRLRKNRNGLEENRILHYQQPLIYQNQLVGSLLLGYSLKGLDKDLASQKETTLYTCLAILVVGITFSVIISNRITSNITKLNNAVKEIASGNTGTQVHIKHNDEIGELADTFNEMTVKLNESREELLSSKQYTENIIMSMLDSLLVLDEQNNIIKANQAALDLFEYTETEFYGKNFTQLFNTQDIANIYIQRLQQESFLKNQESIYITKNGKLITVLFSAAVINDLQGVKQGVVCVAQDISDRKKSESQLKEYSAKLEKSNKELDKFNYVVSHDLKAPLRALYKLSEWIQEDIESVISEESRKNMEMLRGRISRMEGLINGLLEYSKTGRLIKLPEMVNVNGIIEEVIEQLAPPPTFTFCIQPDMPTFLTQRKRLQHVFMHLINNAIRFNDKPEGKIKITFTSLDGFYQFVIEDNGPGIEQQYYEKVFAIFQTLEARDKLESTGIGLTIVKKIVEEHNGNVWVDSVLGQTTTFYFTWPMEC